MHFWRHIASRLRRSQEEEFCPLTFYPDGSWTLLCDDSLSVKIIGNNLSEVQTGGDTRFPIEIWRSIIDHLVEAYITRDGNGAGVQFTRNKMRMSALRGLACASKLHRKMILEFWANTFNPLRFNDPSELKLMAHSNGVEILRYVRRVVCRDQYQIYKAPQHAFQPFAFIEELVFDGHSDIDFGISMGHWGITTSQATTQQASNQNDDDEPSQQQELPPPRMSYRRLAVTFPPTLHTLRVYNGHAPDIHLIHKATRECPKLRTLTLARCTLFTMTRCKFWSRLPRSEHDAYFNNQQVAEYATAVGKELARLPVLETVQIGVYLTEHSAIRMHIEEHAGLGPEAEMSLSGWQHPCEKCTDEYQWQTDRSQQEATTVLAKLVPSLVRVSWLSFCSKGRTEWDSQYILRDGDGYFKGLAAR